MSAANFAAATSTSRAGGPRSAVATRPSARSPAPRPLPISAPRGSPCRRAAKCGWMISDSSPIRSRSPEPLRAPTGVPVVGFNILRAKGASDVTLAEAVAARIETIKAANPDVGLKLIDTSVTHTIGNYESAMDTLYEGAILAVIVVFLFLRDWRATIIAAVTLPLSIFPAFWVMHLLGFSLNVVTLLAITLSTGILVDDAIVEIENIVRHIRMGKSPYLAALEAADEIGLAVIAISLAIVAVFIPASFMPSVPGQFFKQFGITVSVQVLFSLLCARMITPMLAAYFLRS